MKKINSRAKGHGFEREICQLLNRLYKLSNTKYKFQRVPQSGGFDKENFPGDIFSTHDSLILATQVSIECKFYKDWKLEDLINGNKPRMWDWWTQCKNDAELGEKIPLLIFKKNRSDAYFMAYQNDLETLGVATLYGFIVRSEKERRGIKIGVLSDLLETIQRKENEETTPSRRTPG